MSNKVTTQELRQVWAEKVPGAVGTLARAFGVTPALLMTWVEAGNLSKDDVIVALLGAAGAGHSLTAEEAVAVSKFRARKEWAQRNTALCKCDHNEYCQHCYPESFRPGGVWHGLGA